MRWFCLLSRVTPLVVVLSAACEEGTIVPESSTSEESSEETSEGESSSSSVNTEQAITTDTAASEATDAPGDVESVYVRCESAIATGSGAMIDDFEDEDLWLLPQDGRDGDWYWYHEGATDSQVTVTAAAIPGGRGESRFAAHLEASVDQWAGLGFAPHPSEGQDAGLKWCLYDATAYEGLRFWARGSGTLRIKFYSPETFPLSEGGICQGLCWDDHGTWVTLNSEWTEHTVPFAELEQQGWGEDAGPFDPTRIRTIQLQLDSFGSLDFWIDDISFYPGPPGISGSVDGSAVDGGTVDGGSTQSADASVPTDSGTTPGNTDASISADASAP